MATKLLNQETSRLRARYAKDLEFYAKDALRIVTKDAKLVPLKFNYSQGIVHAKFVKQLKETGRIRAIILKARQEGISTYTAARIFRRIHLYKNQNTMVIADAKNRGATLFSIYDSFYRNLRDEVRPKKRYHGKGQQLWFDTTVGPGGMNSKVNVGTAGDKETGRAATVQALHASEVAFWDNAEDLWVGLTQSIPKGNTEIVIESTANGIGNFFHQMWESAVSGDNGYIPIFLPWFIHDEYEMKVTEEEENHIRATLSAWEQAALNTGVEWEGELLRLTTQQIAWRRTKIKEDFRGDERAFRQEYPATPREAFLVSGNCFFDEEVLSEYDETADRPVFRGNLARRQGAIAPLRNELGYLRVWKFPQPKGHYVIFADTAEGRQSSMQREVTFSDPDMERGGRDFCSADVFDVISRAYVAQLHGRMSPELFAEHLSMLGYYYTGQAIEGTRRAALIGVERNHSSGETALRWLRDAGYPHLYSHRLINRRTNRRTTQLGWITNAENRMPMLDEFAAALRDNSIGLPNRDTIRECYTFIRNDAGRPEAQEGTHDDRVISAAGALQMARHSQPPIKVRRLKVAVANTPTGWAEYR